MKTILLVEDEELLSYIYRERLMKAGYKVTVANTGKECLDFLKSSEPDLILLDIKLPDMSGLQILEEWRGISSYVPVIILSAYESFQTEYDVWASKVSDSLLKPIALKDLLEKIREKIGE